MAFFTALALTRDAVIASTAVAPKRKPSRLIDLLLDGQPKEATLLPTPPVITRTQQLARDLFGDTHRQQQAVLNDAQIDTAGWLNR